MQSCVFLIKRTHRATKVVDASLDMFGAVVNVHDEASCGWLQRRHFGI